MNFYHCKRDKKCPHCGGSGTVKGGGFENPIEKKCSECDGKGRVPD